MASSAVIGLLRVLLSANSAQFTAEMKKAADSAKAWSKDLKQVGQQATQVGTALTKTLTLPIAGVGIAAAKLAIDFESSFAGVRKTVSATEPELAQLADGFRNLSKTIPINVNELNKIGESAGALGIRKEDILEFSSVMAQLGVTTNLTSDQAATSIAQIQNIFNAAGKDTKNFASALVALGNDGASTESQIVDFASRLAGAGHQIGLSQQSVLGFSAALANMGLNAELGGTALSKVMSKMSVAVDTGGAKLKAFADQAGMSSAAFRDLFKSDPTEAILRFTEGLGKSSASGKNLTIILNELGLKGSNVQDVMKRLAGGAGQMRGAVDLAAKAWQENTALTAEAQKRFETTESKLLLLGNRVKDVGITLGNAMGPAIDLTIRGLNALIPVLEKMAGMFGALPDWVQLGVVAFAAIVAAAGPVIYIFGQIALSASAIAGAFSKKGIATRLLVGDLDALGTSAGTTTSALGLLGKAASVAGAFFVGWEIGNLITELTGLDTAVARSVKAYEDLSAARARATGISSNVGVLAVQISDLQQKIESLRKQGFGDGAEVAQFTLRLQTLQSQMDVVNRAILHGAASTISYTDAIKFNEQWEQKRIAALNTGTVAHEKHAAATDTNSGATEKLTTAHKKHIALLKEIEAAAVPLTLEQEQQVVSLEKLGLTHSKIAAYLGVSETRVDAFTVSLKKQTKALEDQLKIWADLPSVSAAGPGFTPIDPKSLYTPDSPLRIPVRMDVLGPIALDPSTLHLGDWAKGIPDTDRKSFWSNLFGTSASSAAHVGESIAQTIVGAFQGGGNAVKSSISQVGSVLAGNIGKSLVKEGGPLFNSALGKLFAGALPVVGSLIGPLASALWGHFFGSAGRDQVKDFAATFGGFDALHVQLNTLGAEGERLWIALTQGVGKNNPEQAKAAIEAINAALAAQKTATTDAAAADKARTADLLSQWAAIRSQLDAFDQELLDPSTTQARADEILAVYSGMWDHMLAIERSSTDVQAAAIDGITAKYAESFKTIDAEYKKLSDSVANEAEEAEMGAQERLDRARMAELEADRAKLEAAQDQEIAYRRATYAETLEAAQHLDVKLRDVFERGYDIPIRFQLPDGWPTVGSSIPSAEALSSGMDSGMFASSRAVGSSAGLTRGGDTHQTIVVKLSEREIARASARGLPGYLQIQGVGR